MKENIAVSMDTHPELYRKDLELGLDITGDMITIDKDTKTICRFPIINIKQVAQLRDDDPIWKYFQ